MNEIDFYLPKSLDRIIEERIKEREHLGDPLAEIFIHITGKVENDDVIGTNAYFTGYRLISGGFSKKIPKQVDNAISEDHKKGLKDVSYLHSHPGEPPCYIRLLGFCKPSLRRCLSEQDRHFSKNWNIVDGVVIHEGCKLITLPDDLKYFISLVYCEQGKKYIGNNINHDKINIIKS